MKIELKGLSEAVCSWLTYKHVIGCNAILDEGSLTEPVSQFFRGNGFYVDKSFKHPALISKRSGSKKTLDFVARDIKSGRIACLIEAKFIRGKSVDLYPIIKDAVRLAAYNGGERCCMLIAAAKSGIGPHPFSTSYYKRLFDCILRRDLRGNYRVEFDKLPNDEIRHHCENAAQKHVPHALSGFSVKCLGECETSHYATALWSICGEIRKHAERARSAERATATI